MDGRRFDDLTRTLGVSVPTRRGVLRLLGGSSLLTLLTSIGAEEAAAQSKKPPKQKCRGGKKRCGKRCCRKRQRCSRGQCVRADCDVCARGCAFRTVPAAVRAARAGGTIRLCPGSFRGNIKISRSLNLIGAGIDATRLIGGRPVLSVGPSATVRISALTVTGAAPASGLGGGIRNHGRLTLTAVRVTNNHDLHGGGLKNEGPVMTLNGCIVSGNTAATAAGGISNASGTLTLNGSTVSGNTAGTAAGGIGNSQVATLVLINSVVAGNTATTNFGGGIANAGVATLDASQVSDNSAIAGGGIDNFGTLTCQNGTSVVGNTASSLASSQGGGILNRGELRLFASRVDDNTASEGSGIANHMAGSVLLDGSHVTSNDANARGGGIDNRDSCTLTSQNGSTITGNTAGLAGGGINNEGTATVEPTSVTGNNPDQCSGTNPVTGC